MISEDGTITWEDLDGLPVVTHGRPVSYSCFGVGTKQPDDLVVSEGDGHVVFEAAGLSEQDRYLVMDPGPDDEW